MFFQLMEMRTATLSDLAGREVTRARTKQWQVTR
jgi:hypothetical protein